LGISLGLVSFARVPNAPTAGASSPGSTCQNSVDPLSNACDSWLARYAFPGSSADIPAGVAVSADGKRAFVAGTSRYVQTFEDYTTVAFDMATGQRLWVGAYDGPGHFRDAL